MPIDMHNGDYVRLADILQPHVNLSVPVSFFVFSLLTRYGHSPSRSYITVTFWWMIPPLKHPFPLPSNN